MAIFGSKKDDNKPDDQSATVNPMSGPTVSPSAPGSSQTDSVAGQPGALGTKTPDESGDDMGTAGLTSDVSGGAAVPKDPGSGLKAAMKTGVTGGASPTTSTSTPMVGSQPATARPPIKPEKTFESKPSADQVSEALKRIEAALLRIETKLGSSA